MIVMEYVEEHILCVRDCRIVPSIMLENSGAQKFGKKRTWLFDSVCKTSRSTVLPKVTGSLGL